MDKFSDDLGPVPPGTVAPTTVTALIDKLRVEDEPAEVQERAIQQWLASNAPTDMLVFSLQRRGYDHLLSHAGSDPSTRAT